MSCNFHVKEALLKAANKKRVRDLFTARDAVKAALVPPVVFCYLCEDDMDNCHHDKCCQNNMDDPYNWYCPRCGEFMQDDDDF